MSTTISSLNDIEATTPKLPLINDTFQAGWMFPLALKKSTSFEQVCHTSLPICLQCLERTSKRKRKALSAETIDMLMARKCCKNNCIPRKLTKEEIVQCRKAFQDLTEEDKRSLIVNFFKLSQFHRNGRRHYSFRVNGKDVCRTAWLRANSVSATTWVKIVDENFAIFFLTWGLIRPVLKHNVKRLVHVFQVISIFFSFLILL